MTSRFSHLSQESQITVKQIEKLKISLKLTSDEQEFLLKILMKQEECLTWNMSELDQIHSEIASLQIIHTVLHEVWQVSSFLILKDLIEIVVKMLQSYIKAEVLKYCNESYRNSWFLIKKKKSEKYWIVNVCMNMNQYTVWDANLSSSVEEFAEKNAEMAVVILINFYFRYNQYELHFKSHDMTAFQTPLELL